MKSKIEVRIINGKPCVKATDLYKNPMNEKIYDQSAEDDLGKSMLKRKEKGLTPNIQPVTYWPCGMIDSGNTRTGASVSYKIVWIWAVPSDAPFPNEELPYDEVSHTLDGNIYRQKNWSVRLREYQAAKDAYRKQYGLDMPPSEKELLLKRIGLTPKYARYLEEIQHHSPELMKVVDEGGGVEHNWKLATGQLNATVIPAKKNGMNLASLFNDKRTQSKLVTTAIKYAQDFRDLTLKFDDFDISPFARNECGKWESGAFTTFLSHTFMSSMAGVLKEMGYNIKTADGHRDDADIWFTSEKEQIEIKCTQFNGHGSATKWSGGNNIRVGKYLLVAHDLEFDNIFVAFTSLVEADWGNPDINSKKTMKLSDWWLNHKDDKDIQVWKGSVQIVKTNKIKEGQVQMHLSPVNEPI